MLLRHSSPKQIRLQLKLNRSKRRKRPSSNLHHHPRRKSLLPHSSKINLRRRMPPTHLNHPQMKWPKKLRSNKIPQHNSHSRDSPWTMKNQKKIHFLSRANPQPKTSFKTCLELSPIQLLKHLRPTQFKFRPRTKIKSKTWIIIIIWFRIPLVQALISLCQPYSSTQASQPH
jgi:hypothetical protein